MAEATAGKNKPMTVHAYFFVYKKLLGSKGVIMDFFIKWNHKSVVMFVLASAVLFNPVLTYAEQISQALK
ncbi:MAG: hypothetical protein U9N47_09900, partial [Thermodesulfobacteriota bacterium]|nr:hypothetical protein [Thermodesulfobacteriota bacterium]